MSNRLTQQIKEAFAKSNTSRELSIQILSLIRHIQNSKIDKKNKETIAFSILRGFSLNDNYLNQLIYTVLNLLLPFENSFIAINILKKDDELGMRLLLKILPEEMIGDFGNIITRGSSMNIISLCRDLVINECIRKYKENNNLEPKLSNKEVFQSILSKRELENYLKNSSASLSSQIVSLKDDFIKCHKLQSQKMIDQYHFMILNSLEIPFSDYHNYKKIQSDNLKEENEFDFSLDSHFILDKKNTAIMKRGIAGVHQIRTEGNLRDYLNVKNAGEMCFCEAVRRLNVCEGDLSMAVLQIQMIFHNTRGALLEDKTNEAMVFSLLRSLDNLSQKYPSKLTMLNPAFLKMNNDITLNILLRTGDKQTINRILNKDCDIFSDNEKGIEILKTFFRIVIKQNEIEKMVDFLRPLMLQRTGFEMKKELVRLYGEILNYNQIMTISKNNESFSIQLALQDGIPDKLLDNFVQEKIFSALTEYIEDCPYQVILKDVFGLINDEKYKISVCNRLLLEQENVRNCAILSLDRMKNMNKKKIKNSFKKNTSKSDSLLKFYMKHRSRKHQSAIKYLLSTHVHNIKKTSSFVKNTRPLPILDKELKVIVHKKIYKNYFYVIFSLINTTKELDIKDGKIHIDIANENDLESTYKNKTIRNNNYDLIISENNKIEIPFEMITPLQTKTIVLKRERKENEEFYNVICDYELQDKTTTESENETRGCKEFSVNLIDYIKIDNSEKQSNQANKSKYEKTLSFAIENKSTSVVKDELLDVLNMKIIDQNYDGDCFYFSLSGDYIDKDHNELPVTVNIKMENMHGDIGVFVKITGDKYVADGIASILQ